MLKARNICTRRVGFLNAVGSEALTEVVVKSSIFRDITPCSPLEVILQEIFRVKEWGKQESGMKQAARNA
jgi:hypothetical protein